MLDCKVLLKFQILLLMDSLGWTLWRLNTTLSSTRGCQRNIVTDLKKKVCALKSSRRKALFSKRHQKFKLYIQTPHFTNANSKTQKDLFHLFMVPQRVSLAKPGFITLRWSYRTLTLASKEGKVCHQLHLVLCVTFLNIHVKVEHLCCLIYVNM